MHDYKDLVRQYEKKLEEQRLHCQLTLIDPEKHRDKLNSPSGSAETNLLYLGYGRNAWHSTWINRYYSGSISFFDKTLKEIAEARRVQGSQFKITCRPGLVLNYASGPILILSINDRPFSAYETILSEVMPWRLGAFWASSTFQVPNWLLVFKLSGWRPELFPKNDMNIFAEPQGTNMQLKWSSQIASAKMDGFPRFRDEFFSRFLDLQHVNFCPTRN